MVKFRVYKNADGCGLEFCGEYDSLGEAVTVAEKEPNGLPEFLWATARAAGRCYGFAAPDSRGEESEPLSWHGVEGFHCVVRVTYQD